jgi:hypothetical protein
MHDLRQVDTHQGPMTDANNFVCGTFSRAIHKCQKCGKYEVHTVYFGEDARKWKVKTLKEIVSERIENHDF